MPARAREEDATQVDLCPSCRAQATAVAAAHLEGLIVTFVVTAGARWPWTAILRRDTSVLGLAVGHTMEDALVDVLRATGVVR